MGVLIVFLLILVAYLFYSYSRLKKEMVEFSEYINKAIDGNLELDDFDEREVSKLKSKLIKFLYGNQIKEFKLEREQNKTRDLIADISHQTKTPISNLSLYTDLLEKNYSKEYLDIIKYELSKLEFLIENLVKSSRLESNIIVIQKSQVRLSSLVEDVINEFRGRLEAKKINIDCNCQDFNIDLDERWTREAVHNLLDNAIKYSPKNSVINVSVYKTYLNYNLDIVNECEDMNEEDLAKMFKRFYRGKNSISKDGFGLGLFIVKEIIEKQGGTIKASLDSNKIKFSVDFLLWEVFFLTIL